MKTLIAIASLCALACETPGAGGENKQQTDQVSEMAFGSLDSPEEHVIGEVTDLAFLDKAGIVMLDARASRITILNDRLQYVTSAGRNGLGPGELSGPTAVTTLGNHVYVVENGGQRISMFTLVQDSLKFDHSVIVEHDVGDMCSMRNVLYIQGHHQGSTIHAYDSTGVHLRSFGSLVTTSVNHPVMKEYLEDGSLACDPDTERIYFASSALPVVQTYSSNGELLRTDSVTGFVGAKFIPQGKGLQVRMPDEGYSDGIVRLEAIPGSGLLVQVLRVKVGPGAIRQRDYRTYYVPLDSGGAKLVNESPGSRYSLHRSTAYLMEDEPHPRIRAVDAQAITSF